MCGHTRTYKIDQLSQFSVEEKGLLTQLANVIQSKKSKLLVTAVFKMAAESDRIHPALHNAAMEYLRTRI